MPKSIRITLADMDAIARLLGECRELGDDPITWRQHLFAELHKLVDADVVLGGEMAGCLYGPLASAGTTAWGFERGFNVDGWRIMMEWFAKDPFIPVSFRKVIGALRRTDQAMLTAARPQLVDDRQWDRTPDYQVVGRTMGVAALQHSFIRIAGTEDEFSGMLLFRACGEAEFSEREVALVDLLHRQAAAMIGHSLARWSEPSPMELSPRLRQVLRCLLEGDSDKQIASRLGLSQHTVNDYTKVVYRHFGVGGRAELLARWIRRGWTSRAEWVAAAEADNQQIPKVLKITG